MSVELYTLRAVILTLTWVIVHIHKICQPNKQRQAHKTSQFICKNGKSDNGKLKIVDRIDEFLFADCKVNDNNEDRDVAKEKRVQNRNWQKNRENERFGERTNENEEKQTFRSVTVRKRSHFIGR